MKEFLRDNNVSKADFLKKTEEFVSGKTIEELQKMIEGENKNKLPVIVALCISAFIHDMKTGVIDADINTFLDKVFGEKREAKPDAPK